MLWNEVPWVGKAEGHGFGFDMATLWCPRTKQTVRVYKNIKSIYTRDGRPFAIAYGYVASAQQVEFFSDPLELYAHIINLEPLPRKVTSNGTSTEDDPDE